MNSADIDAVLEHALPSFVRAGAAQAGEHVAQRRAARELRSIVEPILAAGDAVVGALVRRLDAGGPVRALVYRLLALVPAPTAIDALVSAARSRPVDESYVASHYLGQADASAACIPALIVASAHPGRAPLAQAALAVLARIRDPVADEAVERAFQAEERATRVVAANGFAQRDDAAAREALSRGVRHQHWDVRLIAARGRIVNGDRAAFAVVEELSRAKTTAVRADVHLELAKIGLPEAAEVVRRGLGDPAPSVRERALLGVLYPGHAALLLEALPLLSDARPRVRAQATAIYHALDVPLAPLPRREMQRLAMRVATAGGRHHRAHPWTAAAVAPFQAHELAHPFLGPQLAAAAGRSFGVEGGRDLLANLQAIEASEAWAATETASWAPGGWYYQGARL